MKAGKLLAAAMLWPAAFVAAEASPGQAALRPFLENRQIAGAVTIVGTADRVPEIG